MICPQCHRTCNGIEHDACQRSTVRIVRTTDPKLPRDHYWDEDGNEHSHNPSVIVTEFECSNGHRFAEQSSWQCHVCGYMACPQEIILAPEPQPIPAGAERRPAGNSRTITAEQRAEINRKRGR